MHRFVICFILTVFLLWAGGLAWFVLTIPTHVDNPSQKTDAIVVLTGGTERIETALKLIDCQLAQRLLISGVNPQTTLKDILGAVTMSYKNLDPSIIDLDYQSDSTCENAQQTAKWIWNHNFRSVRLVTAHYHIHRSLLEFYQRLPDVEIIVHPIVPRIFQKGDWYWNLDAWSILWREYHKYVGALLVYSQFTLCLSIECHPLLLGGSIETA